MKWKTKKNKHNAKRTEVDGMMFHSKMEAKRYCELKILVKTDEIKWFTRQVPFWLPGNVKYIADFLIVWKDGNVTVEDVKGQETPLFKVKKKQIENAEMPWKNKYFDFKLFVNKMGAK